MKKINVLFDLQLSVLTNLQDGKFIFETDSNVNVATFTIKGLLKKNPNYHFYLIVPPPEKIVNWRFTDTLDAEFKERVTFIEYPYFGNPFVERMSFDSASLMKSLKDIHIDLVYTNDPNKVMSYKTFFYMKQNEFVKILNRVHWVTGQTHRKVPEEIDFIIRQIEGVLYSDVSTFNSNAAINLLVEGAKEHFNDKVIEQIKNKSLAVETVDVEKLQKYKEPKNETAICNFLFAHRLSYYTGYEEVFELLSEIYQEGITNFSLTAPDPGNKFDQDELMVKYPFFKKVDKETWDHSKYLSLCWKSDVAIGNHNIPTSWGGLALTEPMSAQCAPMMPYKDGYLEMWYNDKSVFFSNREEMKNLFIKYITNVEFRKAQQKRALEFVTEELSMSKYIDVLDALIVNTVNH